MVCPPVNRGVCTACSDILCEAICTCVLHLLMIRSRHLDHQPGVIYVITSCGGSSHKDFAVKVSMLTNQEVCTYIHTFISSA